MSSFMLSHGSSRRRNRKESSLLLCTTSALEAVEHFTGPELAELGELLGLYGSREMGRIVLGRILKRKRFSGRLQWLTTNPARCKSYILYKSHANRLRCGALVECKTNTFAA